MSDTADKTNQKLTATPPASALVEPQYKVVGGWLLLFCFILTIFGPVTTLGSLAAGYKEHSKFFNHFPVLAVITIIDTILSLGLAAFGIYAGFKLWLIKQGAVRTAKRYLLCFLGYHAIAALLPFLAGLPPAFYKSMLGQIAKDIVKSIILFFIWYSYLNKSQRVKKTYDI